MEYWWTDTNGRKPKNSEKNLFLCHSVHHKSRIDWSGIECQPPQWKAGN